MSALLLGQSVQIGRLKLIRLPRSCNKQHLSHRLAYDIYSVYAGDSRGMSTNGVEDGGASTGALVDEGTLMRSQGEPSSSGSAARGPDLDDHGFAFHLWNYKEQPPLQVGDDVFVSLRTDKDTGKAKVLQDAITEPGHQYKGRYKVEFYDGTGFYHVRRGKMVKVKAAALREAEKTTGHYIGFDSPHGNYLLPALPYLSSPSAAAISGGPAAKSGNSEPSTPVSPRP